MNITQRYCGVCGHGYRVRVDTNGNGGLQETPAECPHCEGGKMKCPNCGKEYKSLQGVRVHQARTGCGVRPVKEEPPPADAFELADEVPAPLDKPGHPEPDRGPVCVSAFLVPGGSGSLELVICDGNGPAFALQAHPNFELVDRRPE
jgi:hypothetical protein